MSYLFTGPNAITPWIEKSTAAAIRGTPVECRTKMVQVVEVVRRQASTALAAATNNTSNAQQRPPCYRIHDGEYSIPIYLVSPQAQTSVQHPRPTVGCILKVQDWKVSTQALVISQQRPDQRINGLCLAIYGAVEHSGGDGIGVSGRLEDIHNSPRVRQELHSIQNNQSTLHQRLRSQWLDGKSPSPMRQSRTTAAAQGNNNNPLCNNNVAGKEDGPLFGDVEALFESDGGQHELDDILDSAGIPQQERPAQPHNNARASLPQQQQQQHEENGFTVYTINGNHHVAYVVRDQTHMQDIFSDVLEMCGLGRSRATDAALDRREKEHITTNGSSELTTTDVAVVQPPNGQGEKEGSESPTTDTAVMTNQTSNDQEEKQPTHRESPQTQEEGKQTRDYQPAMSEARNNDDASRTSDHGGKPTIDNNRAMHKNIASPVSKPHCSTAGSVYGTPLSREEQNDIGNMQSDEEDRRNSDSSTLQTGKSADASAHGTPRSKEQQNGISNMLCDDSQSEEEDGGDSNDESSTRRQAVDYGKPANERGDTNGNESDDSSRSRTPTQMLTQEQPPPDADKEEENEEEAFDDAELDDFLESQIRKLHCDDSSDCGIKRHRRSETRKAQTSGRNDTPAARIAAAEGMRPVRTDRVARQDTSAMGTNGPSSGVSNVAKVRSTNTDTEEAAPSGTEPQRERDTSANATRRRPAYLQKFLQNVERNLASPRKRRRFDPPPLKSDTHPPPFGNRVRSWLQYWKSESCNA